MNTVNMNKYIEAWLANNETRANTMSMQIQKITDEYLEICIDGQLLQIVIPHNFHTSCSSDGIICNTDCAFIATLTNAKWDECDSLHKGADLMIELNDKLERLSSRGFYSFASVLDSIVDVLEKYKISSTESDEAASVIDVDVEDEEEEDGWSDSEGYSMAIGTIDSYFCLNEGQQKSPYFDQLIEDANEKCDGARSRVVQVPGSQQNIKDGILRWCKVYSSSRNKWCALFEIELTGILSDYSRHGHVNLYEALGFSFATPLVIEVKFQSLGNNFKSTNLEAQGESLSRAFQRLLATHMRDIQERNFVYRTACDGQDDLYEQLIDVSETNPMHLYGLRSLLPRIGKDFFSRGGRDRDPNVLLEGEDNIFVRFLLFTGSRLASLLKRCIVCDKELPFIVSRLCSCADELCMFSFEVLGLGTQVLQELARMPLELIDLEISLACAAANGYSDVFEPFPPFLLNKREIRPRSDVLDDNGIENPNDFGMINPTNTNKNMGALSSIIKSFPSVSEMRLCVDEAALKSKLAKSWLDTARSMQKLGDEYLPYNVLRFILCTNRLSLVFLSDDHDKLVKLDSSCSGLYQFAVVQDSPERELAYNSINKKHEVSIFGFHRSGSENWYSILRNGLRCLSDTKLMSSGNTKGNGIYLADTFGVSSSYAFCLGHNDRWKNGMYKDGSFCVVGICEIISSLSIKKSGEYVVPKESEGSVALRYLLVYNSAHKDLEPATISNGHILSHGGQSVDLYQHHQSIRRKYASIS